MSKMQLAANAGLLQREQLDAEAALLHQKQPTAEAGCCGGGSESMAAQMEPEGRSAAL